jgi:hypothetical protein
VDNKLSLEQLDVGIEAAISNAESLIQEAALLLQHGFHAVSEWQTYEAFSRNSKKDICFDWQPG